MQNALLNEKVVHPVFGQGVIINREDRTLTVNFPEYGKKRFLFPNAFDQYLKMCDPKLNETVIEYLEQKRPEIEAAKLHKKQAAEAERKHQADEIAQCAKVRKKFNPKKFAKKK